MHEVDIRLETALAPPSPPTSRPLWRSVEVGGWILLVGLLVGLLPVVLHRTTRPSKTDFSQFYTSANYVRVFGERMPHSKFQHYLPSLDAAVAPLTCLPLWHAALVWALIMIAGWALLMLSIRRYLQSDEDPLQARQSLLVASLLVLPLFLDHLCVGAFHILMVWFMVSGLGRASRNQPWSGGILLGLAVWVKLLPVLGVGYLIWKRKLLPAAVAVLTVVVVDAVISLLAYGPAEAWLAHQEWWRTEVQGQQDLILTDPMPLDEDRINNQSMAIVMRHLLSRLGCDCEAYQRKAIRRNIVIESGDVASPEYNALRDKTMIADLSPTQLQAAYTIVMLLIGCGVLYYCRRSGNNSSPKQWASEIALVVLSTLWFSPLVWSYHPTAALPAMALILTRAPRYPRIGPILAVLWLVSLALMGSDFTRMLGVTLWMNLLIGAILVGTQFNAPCRPAPRGTVTVA